MNIMNIMNQILLLAGCKYFLGKTSKKYLFSGYALFIFMMFIMFIFQKTAFFVAKTSFFIVFWAATDGFYPGRMKKNEYLLTSKSQVGENITGGSGRFMNIVLDFMNIAESMFIGLTASSAGLFIRGLNG